MSAFSLDQSLTRARQRLGRQGSERQRTDRGASRFPPAVEQQIAVLLGGQEQPRMAEVHRKLEAYCRRHGLPAPARSSLYNAVQRVPVPAVRWSSLPDAVRRTLYNLEPETEDASIGGDHVVFYAFNYGSPRALSFASGLPWLCLVRAEARSGWRPKSRALLRAVMRYRGL